MVDASVYPKLSRYASLGSEDVVLDAGAGFGFLTRFLANNCKQVIAVEKDPHVAEVLREQVKDLTNVTVIEADVLKVDVPCFNKAVAAPPYYLSSNLVAWLLDRGFECAVLIVQKEFAARLVAAVGSEDYGWLAVAISLKAEVNLLDEVPRWMFHPEPEVDSIIMRLKPWATPPFNVKNQSMFRSVVKWLFTERNKKIGNALVPFIRQTLNVDKAEAKKLAAALPFRDRRARALSPKDFGVLADALTR